MMEAMTADEFIAYANEALSGESLEGLHELITEHNSEVVRFGDSWPGALVRIHASIAEVNSLERQLARLEGRDPRNFRFNVRAPQ